MSQNKRKYTDEEKVAIIRECEQSGNITETCRKHGIHKQTFYTWRQKIGGMDVPDVKRMREIEKENAKLKQLAGDQALIIQTMKEELKKRGWG